jgi:hypothetical protein
MLAAGGVALPRRTERAEPRVDPCGPAGWVTAVRSRSEDRSAGEPHNVRSYMSDSRYFAPPNVNFGRRRQNTL